MPSGKDIPMIILLTIIVILLVCIVAPGLVRVLFGMALLGIGIAVILGAGGLIFVAVTG